MTTEWVLGLIEEFESKEPCQVLVDMVLAIKEEGRVAKDHYGWLENHLESLV